MRPGKEKNYIITSKIYNTRDKEKKLIEERNKRERSYYYYYFLDTR